jgi:hypothetical protein
MSTELEQFHKEFFQEVTNSARAAGQFAEDAFFDRFAEDLIEAGELDTAHRAYFTRQGSGVRVDGYDGDPKDMDGVLTLIGCDFNQSEQIETLSKTRMNTAFRRLQKFLVKSMDPSFRETLVDSGPAYGLADTIGVRFGNLTKIRLILITNRKLSSRVDGREAEAMENGTPVFYNVWDITRLQRYAMSGRAREDLTIDLEEEFGAGIPLLPAHFNGAGYDAYLAAVPGTQLAAIYDKWGARLLEQNVRCFLQFRGNVNKGMRATISHHPEMFFAYNNGITATAEAIETRNGDGLTLTKLTNFQIVNGGQTTASLHAASKAKDADLSRIFVQMKLSIVDHDRAEEVVPKISQYANTQNKVNAADFFSNHPFHVWMEERSRGTWAPSPEGEFHETKWFYERARGQYQDARANLKPAAKKEFDAQNPKRQMFTKTDLAKFLSVWKDKPYIVARGAQKNFADFAQEVSKAWDKNSQSFNDAYYRRTIARAIIFRSTEKLVSRANWYEGGYRANIVAYSIARLAHAVEQRGEAIDFEQIWRLQKIPQHLERALDAIGAKIHALVLDPPSGIRNAGEWTKKPGCWEAAKALDIDVPSLDGQVITSGQAARDAAAAVQDQAVTDAVADEVRVFNRGGEFWQEALDWGSKKRLLSPSEMGILGVCASIPNRFPSELQAKRAMKALDKLCEEGFPGCFD